MLEDTKTDPRVLRTRQLILDSFRSLIQTRDIKDITIGEITALARINRATFYAHYADKYELMDDSLTKMFRDSLMQKLQCHAVFSRQSLTGIVVTLCQYHQELSTQCQRNYAAMGPYMESKIKELLQEVLYHLLTRELDSSQSTATVDKARIASIMWSWCIYGITYDWNKEGRAVSPEDLAEQAIAAMAQVMAEIEVPT